MTSFRRSLVVALGLALAASTVVPASGQGQEPRELPRVAHGRPMQGLPPVEASDHAGREPATVQSPETRRLAVEDASAYGQFVDPCEPDPHEVLDLRHLGLAAFTASNVAMLTVRSCLEGPQVADLDGQSIVWVLRTTDGVRTQVEITSNGSTPQAKTYRISGGDNRTLLSGPPETSVAIDQSGAVPELRVGFPLDDLALGDTCDLAIDVECLQFVAESYGPGAAAPADTMPGTRAADVLSAPFWPPNPRYCSSLASVQRNASPATRLRIEADSLGGTQRILQRLQEAGYLVHSPQGSRLVEVAAGGTESVVRTIEAWTETVRVDRVPGRQTTNTPDDPEYPRQWYMPSMRVDDAWESTTGSQSVGLAIVDDGLMLGSGEFQGRFGSAYDALTESVIGTARDTSLGRHGTAVAGIAAATGSNASGMAGVDWRSQLFPVRIFDHAGCFVSDARYLSALAWILERVKSGHIHVVNMSFGGPSPIEIPGGTGERQLIDAMVREGAVVVAAMGNGHEFGASVSYPAAFDSVVAVGAVGRDLAIAPYSQRGRHVDVVASGGTGDSATSAILSLGDPTSSGSFSAQTGTSFSTPLVAGVAALYRSRHPASTPSDVVRALITSAVDLGPQLAGFDAAYGYGLVDAAEALRHAPGQTRVRWAGDDRYATAAAASHATFADPSLVDVVLLATGENYPDALAGGPLAAREHAPLLLTPRDQLHEATKEELRRLNPNRVILLGGPTAISSAVADAVAELGIEGVTRASGADRYATAATIALGDSQAAASWRAWNSSDLVYLATGENFPDALPGGAAAAARDAPLLLTARSQLPVATAEALRALRPSQVVILGGPAAVHDDVVAQVDALGITVHRAAGESRYDTAVAAICPTEDLSCHPDSRLAVITTGEGFADALGGSAIAAALRAPLLLVPRNGPVPGVLTDNMPIIAPEQIVVLGGPVAVSEEMARRMGELAVP